MSKINLLIIDNDPSRYDFFLSEFGFYFEWIMTHSKPHIENLTITDFDVILLDHDMSPTNGAEFAKFFVENYSNSAKNFPFIIITSASEKTNIKNMSAILKDFAHIEITAAQSYPEVRWMAAISAAVNLKNFHTKKV